MTAGARGVRVGHGPRPIARDCGRAARRRSAQWGASHRTSSYRTRLFLAPACPRSSRRSRDRRASRACTVCNVFHAGDGNLHPNIPYDANNADESDRVHHAMTEIMEACIAAGGTITGEHGVGLDKLPYMDRLFSPDDAGCDVRAARRVRSGSPREPGQGGADAQLPRMARRAARRGHAPHDWSRRSSRRAEAVAARVREARVTRTTLRIVGGGHWLDAGRPCHRDRLARRSTGCTGSRNTSPAISR